MPGDRGELAGNGHHGDLEAPTRLYPSLERAQRARRTLDRVRRLDEDVPRRGVALL